MTNWTSSAIIVLGMAAISVPAIGISLWQIGQLGIFGQALIFVSPVTTLCIGSISLIRFASEGVIRDDMIHTMCVAVALGLTLLTLAEVALSMISVLAGSTLFYLVIAFLQFPGLLLWTAGILGYVIVFNRVISLMPQKRLLLILISVSLVSVFSLKVASLLFCEPRGVIESLSCIPIAVCLVMMTGALIMIQWLFRGGRIHYPFGAMLSAVIFYMLQSILWCTLSESPLSPLVRGMALESYLFLGISLVMFRRLGE